MGASQILDAILSEARQDADAAIADAKSTAQSAINADIEAANAQAQELIAQAEEDARMAAERDMLAANLEARKASLGTRRKVLDGVFEQAVDALCALDKDAYIDLITRLVLQSAETGSEQVQVPSEDMDRYTKPYVKSKTMLQILNEALAAEGRTGKLMLSPTPGNFRGGIRLIGEFTDIDCSFSALVAAYRDDHEADISNMIFGAKEN